MNAVYGSNCHFLPLLYIAIAAPTVIELPEYVASVWSALNMMSWSVPSQPLLWSAPLARLTADKNVSCVVITVLTSPEPGCNIVRTGRTTHIRWGWLINMQLPVTS